VSLDGAQFANGLLILQNPGNYQFSLMANGCWSRNLVRRYEGGNTQERITLQALGVDNTGERSI